MKFKVLKYRYRSKDGFWYYYKTIKTQFPFEKDHLLIDMLKINHPNIVRNF